MRKNLKALLVVILMMVAGAGIGYAAFPIASQNPATAVAGSNTSSDETTMQPESAAAHFAKSMPAPEGKHGGKSQVIALILCIFLGGLGIHRFYLGYTWQGIVQLLTLGGCGIWALIDLIRIITGDLGPKDGRYAKTF